MASLKNRAPEVIFCLLALTRRFSDHDRSHADIVMITNEYVEVARKIVWRSVYEGSVCLSTLQSLCLLSFMDFNSKSHICNKGQDLTGVLV